MEKGSDGRGCFLKAPFHASVLVQLLFELIDCETVDHYREKLRWIFCGHVSKWKNLLKHSFAWFRIFCCSQIPRYFLTLHFTSAEAQQLSLRFPNGSTCFQIHSGFLLSLRSAVLLMREKYDKAGKKAMLPWWVSLGINCRYPAAIDPMKIPFNFFWHYGPHSHLEAPDLRTKSRHPWKHQYLNNHSDVTLNLTCQRLLVFTSYRMSNRRTNNFTLLKGFLFLFITFQKISKLMLNHIFYVMFLWCEYILYVQVAIQEYFCNKHDWHLQWWESNTWQIGGVGQR